jgi:hypothetical protein
MGRALQFTAVEFVLLGRRVPIWEYYQLVLIPLPLLIFWNHGVRARPPSKSLRNKDLHVKYSGIRT